MSFHNRNIDNYLIKRLEIQNKKKNNLHVYRRSLKRKRSLTSCLSFTSTVSINNGQTTTRNDRPIENLSSISVSDQVSLLAPDFDNVSISSMIDSDSNDDSDVPIDDETSLSDSSDDSSDTSNDDADEHAFTILSGEQKLYASAELTVRDFSMDILEFYRSSRLPNNQRNQLLHLFKKYLPSPNSVPKSSESLSSKSLTW